MYIFIGQNDGMGHGTGQFTAGMPVSGGTYGTQIVAADFNNDGNADVAVVSPTQGAVEILLGNGNGALTAAPGITGLSNPFGVAVGDFNNDGIPDLAIANDKAPLSMTGTNQVVIELGDGAGNFAPPMGSSPTP